MTINVWVSFEGVVAHLMLGNGNQTSPSIQGFGVDDEVFKNIKKDGGDGFRFYLNLSNKVQSWLNESKRNAIYDSETIALRTTCTNCNGRGVCPNCYEWMEQGKHPLDRCETCHCQYKTGQIFRHCVWCDGKGTLALWEATNIVRSKLYAIVETYQVAMRL